MPKRKRKVPKSNRFTVMTSYEATMAAKPRYDAFAIGHGPQGKRGYDRNAQKRAFARELGKPGSLDFSAYMRAAEAARATKKPLRSGL